MEKEFEKLKEILIERGASFVGFCDISDLPNSLGYKGAISIGYKLLDSFIDQIDENEGPTYQYFHHYRDVNTALDQLSLFAATFLDRLGIKALMIPASQSSVEDAYAGAFPHKTAAVLSGEGFIGKSGLFIHEKFGGRVRLSTILVDYPLTSNKPIIENGCGNCTKCRDSCPSGAISGNIYKLGDDRSTIFNAEKCSTYMKKAYQQIGRGSVCGICIKVCPMYLKGKNNI